MNADYLQAVRYHILEPEPEFIRNVAKELNLDIKDVSVDIVKITNHDKGIVEHNHYITLKDETIVIKGHSVIEAK